MEPSSSLASAKMLDAPTSAADVIAELAAAVKPALLASAGPRYFGFVIGGSLDAASW